VAGVFGTPDSGKQPCDESIVTSTVALQGHPEEVYACEFVGGGGRQMVTASADELVLWDLETRQRMGRGGPIPISADLAGGPWPGRCCVSSMG